MNVEHSFPIELETKAGKPALYQWLQKNRWLAIFVILPTLVATVYYSLFAADIYVSESSFVIKSPDQKRGQISSLANLIQTTGLSGAQDQANEVLAYVRSRDALKALEKDSDIESKFASQEADFISRFPQPLQKSGFESLYKYYKKMVSAKLDTETGMAVISVKAFNPRDAYQINSKLLSLSEDLVNRLNARAQASGIAEAQKQVRLALTRAKQARIALSHYRNAEELIDPEKQAGGAIEIANTMIAQRAALQAQLDQIKKDTPNNPAIPALRNRIQAISVQIAGQDKQVVGNNTSIASKLGDYEGLLVEQEFATENLNAANARLVQAQAEAQKQQFYLERVVEPNVADIPLLPHRILSIIVVAATSLCLYFIGWMLIVGILEHAPDD